MPAWEVRQTTSCIWIVIRVSPGIRLGVRTAFAPTGLPEVAITPAGRAGVRISARGGQGLFRVRARFEGRPAILRITTSLTPAEPLRVTAAPRDLCVLDHRLNPYSGTGRLYTCQTGCAAGHSFFSALEGTGGTVFYFQNFTALGEYFRKSGASLADTVHGEWPEAGFSLPAGDQPLEPGAPVVISDALIRIWPGVMESEAEAALSFLDALAGIYPRLEHPDCPWQDWPDAAQKTLRHLTASPACSRRIRGRRYIEAYAGSTYKPPESMVQGALIVPLLEFAAWQRRPIRLLEQLAHAPASFHDAKLRIPLRWLPGAAFKRDATSEEECRFRMDSWYLLHTMMNLARMAELGMKNAETVFLNSVDSLVGIARHFDYDWPVFFDQRNLAVFKQETAPGEGGEQDASGLYIQVMLHAHQLTREKHYLEEAETAATKLQGQCFGVLYQTNNTVMGATALARLWKATGKSAYRDLSFVSMAGTFSHLWLWHCGPDTRTFMGLPPLHDAPYIALYEEAEIAAALVTYQDEMGSDLPPALALLCAEYHKHLLARAGFYFPGALPEDAVTDEPKEGVLHRQLNIPLEGLGPPGEKAGTVGQAVYAAAGPFVLTTRAWHRIPGAPFTLFCSYPVFGLQYESRRNEGSAEFRIGGSRLLSCRMKIIPAGRRKIRFRIRRAKGGNPLAESRSPHGLDTELRGDCSLRLEWERTHG